MIKYVAVALTAVILILSSFITGCASAPTSSPAAVTQPAATTPAATSPATPAPASTNATTAGQLAEAGKDVFAGNCAKCHGSEGAGGGASALTGDKAKPSKYSTAQQLFEFISTGMPPGKGGSLSKQAYLQVIAFLLVKNGNVQPTAALDAGSLESIKLIK